MNIARLFAIVPVAVLMLATPASAVPPAGVPGFGAHVSSCAQTMGFSGTHNPGMHHGVSDWDGMPC